MLYKSIVELLLIGELSGVVGGVPILIETYVPNCGVVEGSELLMNNYIKLY